MNNLMIKQVPLNKSKSVGGIAAVLAKQAAKPRGLLGLLFAQVMKKMNRPAYDWIIEKMAIHPDDRILELGFGTGYGLQKISRQWPSVTLFGAEISMAMIKQSTRRNRPAIDRGRLTLLLAPAQRLSIASDHLSKVYCVHVIYFWSDLQRELQEIKRVLKPGGGLFIFIGDVEEMQRIRMTQTGVYHLRSVNTVIEALTQCGFTDIHSETRALPSGPIATGICIQAVKPKNRS